MKAIRVQKAKGRAGWHWLLAEDDHKTLCGKLRLSLEVIQAAELERLPATEACHACLRAASGWTQHRVARSGGVFLAPSTGKLRTVGPLSHGTRLGRGGRQLG